MKLYSTVKLQLSLWVTFVLVSTGLKAQSAQSKTLLFLDNSVTNDTYIPSNKETQIEVAFEIARSVLSKKFPSCKINFQKRIERADHLNIFKQAEKIKSELKSESSIIIGLIHSSEAILAAKAFEGTSFQVLSSGATTENLNDLNSNFFTLANPISSFVDQILGFVKSRKSKFILSLIPGNSSYAKEFSESLEKVLIGSGIHFEKSEYNPSNIENDLNNLSEKIKKADVVFTPGFIQQSLAAVSYINKTAPAKTVIGTPNWGRSIPDLVNFHQKLQITNSKIYFPVSWTSGESINSIAFESKFRKRLNEVPMGTAVYTYDAAIIAGSYMCTFEKVAPDLFSNYLSKLKNSDLTTRNYLQLIRGHMTSKITMVEFNGSERLLPVLDKKIGVVKK
jgi:hypothetical protein